jgi:hypothetical protein
MIGGNIATDTIHIPMAKEEKGKSNICLCNHLEEYSFVILSFREVVNKIQKLKLYLKILKDGGFGQEIEVVC